MFSTGIGKTPEKDGSGHSNYLYSIPNGSDKASSF